VFLVERPRKADPSYVRRVVNAQVPFLRELLRVFEATYAQPLQLTRNATAPAFAIAILESRGSYDNYARVTKAPGLHRMRAHYDSSLQLAVSYKDNFTDDQSNANIDERHSLLHEMVHALQHAYSTDGQMPAGLWFLEGLAEYRASCGHLPDRLADPEVNPVSMRVLAAAATRPELRYALAGLKDLLGARSYVDVVKHAQARGRAARTATNDDFALGTFYAQAALFVRFLHEDERYRPGFMACMTQLMRGGSSAAGWTAGFGDVDVAELERQFLVWLTDVLRNRGSFEVGDLAPRAPTDPALAVAALGKTAFDVKALAWTAQDAAFRREAARQLCSAGDYAAALRILPEPEATAAESDKERRRMEAACALRDRVLDDLVQSKQDIKVDVEGKPTSVRVLRRAGDGVVVAVGKNEATVPLPAFRPGVLLAHCWRKKWLAGSEQWLERWLRWLDGCAMDKLRPLLAGSDPALAELRGELTKAFVDAPEVRTIALALLTLQDSAIPEDAGQARRQLDALQQIAQAHGAHPVFAARRGVLADAARALAERAFVLDNPAAFGLSGQVQAQAGGRFTVTYEGGAHRAFDMAPDQAYLAKLPATGTQIAYSGAPVLRPAGEAHEAIGHGFFRWPLPLRGKVVIELDQAQAAGGALQLVFCDDKEGSHLEADPFGLYVIDLRAQPPLIDHVGVVHRTFMPSQVYRVRVEHDGGNQARVLLDGKELAPWRSVGTRSAGWLGLYVFSSNAISLPRLLIEGELDASQIPALRARFVDEVVARVRGAAAGK
jgi:hypothetical protein